MEPNPNSPPSDGLFAALPVELVDYILTFLSPLDLISLGSTCRRLHRHSQLNTAWIPHIASSIHRIPALPPQYPSYRHLYAAHRPFWFLPKQKIWFADEGHGGKLVLCRYSAERDCIEGYSVAAERGSSTMLFWDWNPEVMLHTFEPRVRLDLDAPVVKLEANAYDTVRERARVGTDVLVGEEAGLGKGKIGDDAQGEEEKWASLLYDEVPMRTFARGGDPQWPGATLHSRFMLTRSLPEELIRPGIALWPPLIVPSPSACASGAGGKMGSRTRNSSIQVFRGKGHKPSHWREINEAAFRIRKWAQFGHQMRNITAHLLNNTNVAITGDGLDFVARNAGGIGARVGEYVTTFATVDPKAYTPSKQKPWRGIWVGDYRGHGCEFLLILQPDNDEIREGKPPLPESAAKLLRQMDQREAVARLFHKTGRESKPRHETAGPVAAIASPGHNHNLLGADCALSMLDMSDTYGSNIEEEDDHQPDPSALFGDVNEACDDNASDSDLEDDVYRGGIEAVKLTGDLNVPRGEYTFIAPDISSRGLVRIASEEMFKGARVVRSIGHIAHTGFRDDGYTESQLILVSNDTLAQYWKAFGHISFYKRVDIDQFLNVD